jgi:hypothetical protein
MQPTLYVYRPCRHFQNTYIHTHTYVTHISLYIIVACHNSVLPDVTLFEEITPSAKWEITPSAAWLAGSERSEVAPSAARLPPKNSSPKKFVPQTIRPPKNSSPKQFVPPKIRNWQIYTLRLGRRPNRTDERKWRVAPMKF